MTIQAKLGQDVDVLVVAKKVEAVVRKRATTTAHQAEPNLVKCPHALDTSHSLTHVSLISQSTLQQKMYDSFSSGK